MVDSCYGSNGGAKGGVGGSEFLAGALAWCSRERVGAQISAGFSTFGSLESSTRSILETGPIILFLNLELRSQFLESSLLRRGDTCGREAASVQGYEHSPRGPNVALGKGEIGRWWMDWR